ncbi:hypothetical protein GCM10011351_22470 [Paraliobacillus quinghaiensis]|uniref:Uncharacterized protein n=1 Tax=Paraliobacillus quinghaiensis TaxID=470815 RepID=A0A917WWM8_9BACI|nr:hypothetical protein GCM10011351_22470 [Paraliobacillus quinghaiensis]
MRLQWEQLKSKIHLVKCFFFTKLAETEPTERESICRRSELVTTLLVIADFISSSNIENTIFKIKEYV